MPAEIVHRGTGAAHRLAALLRRPPNLLEGARAALRSLLDLIDGRRRAARGVADLVQRARGLAGAGFEAGAVDA
jgi:hypothetical protein